MPSSSPKPNIICNDEPFIKKRERPSYLDEEMPPSAKRYCFISNA